MTNEYYEEWEDDDRYDDYYDPKEYERDTFDALTDGMCGDYDDWNGDWDALDAWMGR